MNRSTSATESGRRGLSLIELLMAFFLTAFIILPIMRALPQAFGIAGRQADQEIAIKIGESTVNTLLAVPFETVSGSPGTKHVPFDLQTGSETLPVSLQIDGLLGSGSIRIGRTDYKIRITLKPEYSGPPPAPTALVFDFAAPPPGTGIATYACPDLFMMIRVDVEYGQRGVPVTLATFRADLRQ
ncbi:hypothetical protein KBA41_00105 [Candidatus Ozemobacteraceae bacterium]|nr:hypothetical protein [Candidatus Ozemobacteraceae bacterium]